MCHNFSEAFNRAKKIFLNQPQLYTSCHQYSSGCNHKCDSA